MSFVLPVARIGGVEVRVHLSWVLLLAIVTLLLAVELPGSYPDWSVELTWLTAGTIALLGFGSVAVHELAHALVARRWRLPTPAITLYAFGGSPSFDGIARRPGEDAAIAAAGPAASLILGAIGLLVWQATAFAIDPVGAAIAIASFLVGVFNVVVALVNLVPGFPLDGGRIVRAVVWRVTGSERRGTRAAGVVGRTLGVVAVVVGFLIVLLASSSDGLLLLVCGWLLTSSARAIDRRLAVEQLVEGVSVGDAMERDGPGVAAGLTLDTFAEEAIAETRGSGLRVLELGVPVGVIGNGQLRRIARRQWPRLRAREVMTALSALPAMAPGALLWDGLELLQRSRLDAVPVVVDGSLVGLLTRRGVATLIAQRDEADRATRVQRFTRPTLPGRWRGPGSGPNGSSGGEHGAPDR